MAYGQKYTIVFKNRIQNDIYRIEIWQKDFVGDITELTGAEVPFTVNWQEVEILSPIKSCEFTINFITDGSIGIEDFYSDDDEGFRNDFYFQSDSSGGGTEKLLHSGFLIQDGTSEPVTDKKHVITLKATDNLALLKSVKWNEAVTQPFGQFPLGYYFRYCLKQTGLYSNDVLLSPNMPLRLFGNLFENTTDDRNDDPEADPYAETVFHSGIFKNTDSTWLDCYSILEQILGSINACIVQADGCWNVLRTTEYSLFADGQMLGTQYVYNGSGTDIDQITLLPLIAIDRTGGDCYPIDEDQAKSILRPYKYILNTFNYNQPGLIIQQDLQIPADAVPYDTETIGDLRYDRYDLATYFPDWVQRDGDGSYLEVVTNISVLPEQENDRYIVTPDLDSTARGVQFNPIPVNKDDVINFSVQYKTPTDTNDELRFGVRFIIVTPDSIVYNLINFPTINRDDNTSGLIWDDFPADEWDQQNGVFDFISDSEADNIDTSVWMTYSLDTFLGDNRVIPPAPVDGILLLQIMGTNAYGAPEHHTTFWKDIKPDIKSFVNASVQIIGQTHIDTGISTIKAIDEEDIYIDDSPRITIAGTLLTDAISTFEYTDSSTGEVTGIGNIYFTKTSSWHRDGISEVLRLGNVITQERLAMRYTSRLIVEGSFRNPRYDTDKFISLLSLFRIAFYAGKSFLPAGMEINYMDCSFRSKLIEVFNDDDAEMTAVFLTGEKEEQLSITTGVIHFDTITNFGGADAYITVTNTNSTFTYINAFNTTVNLSVVFFVPISGSGTATFTIEKNGGVIATQTLNASAHFGHISFDLTESVTNTDYFEAFVDTGGANVDIQSGSINIEINGVQSLVNFPYQFKYLYKTD